MKNILNVTLNEMMETINNEYQAIRKDITTLETKGLKLQRLEEGQTKIFKLFNRLDYLVMQEIIRFPEETEMQDKVRKFKYNMAIQLEDVTNIIDNRKEAIEL
jgi:hypothetical protein